MAHPRGENAPLSPLYGQHMRAWGALGVDVRRYGIPHHSDPLGLHAAARIKAEREQRDGVKK